MYEAIVKLKTKNWLFYNTVYPSELISTIAMDKCSCGSVAVRTMEYGQVLILFNH